MNKYEYEIPSNCRFIKVTGEDGLFYDLVRVHQVNDHINKLSEDEYEASVVNRNSVPPCKFRDFTNGLGTYEDGIWKDGSEFYFK